MTADNEARLIGSIADAIAYLGVQRGGDVLFYAEAGPAWVGGSLFINHRATIEWVSPAYHDITDLVFRLWKSAPDEKKWRGLMVFVGQNSFHTEFDYGEGWSEDQAEGERREPIVLRFLGDKPIIYPALNGGGEVCESANSVTFWNS